MKKLYLFLKLGQEIMFFFLVKELFGKGQKANLEDLPHSKK